MMPDLSLAHPMALYCSFTEKHLFSDQRAFRNSSAFGLIRF